MVRYIKYCFIIGIESVNQNIIMSGKPGLIDQKVGWKKGEQKCLHRILEKRKAKMFTKKFRRKC